MVGGMAQALIDQLLLPLEPMIGTWEGEGRGLWSNPPFRYRETFTLAPVPDRALLTWDQRTVAVETGSLSHSERGYLRLLPGREVELVLAIPAGYTELHRGRVAHGSLELRLVQLGVSPSARRLDRVERRLGRRGGELWHEVAISVGEGSAAPHVSSRLHRVA